MLLHDDLGMTELAAVREAELREEVGGASEAFKAYWAAGSPSPGLRGYIGGHATDLPSAARAGRVR